MLDLKRTHLGSNISAFMPRIYEKLKAVYNSRKRYILSAKNAADVVILTRASTVASCRGRT